ncbi:MAG: hypothetical protein ACLFU3_05610 [Dichotomicrobium sp.]
MLEPVPAPKTWTLEVSLYAWLPWLSGDLTIRGRSFDVSVSPTEIIEHLDWSSLPIWMSHAEFRSGRFSVFNDIVYTKLADSGDFAESELEGGATLSGNIEADYEQATIELGGAYEVWSAYASAAGPTAIDVLAGGRYWYQDASVEADIDISVELPDLPELSDERVIARSGSVDWIDPFIGARVRQGLAPGHEITLRGDIGGFGVGSDLTWQVIATYDFLLRAGERYVLDGYVGYRALSVDYTQGSGNRRYEFNVLEQGPMLGATLRF